MPTYIALLRAVNVGGYGKLSMADFRKLLEGLGFKNVQTYIQSGNAVFDASGSAVKVGAAIAAALQKLTGAPVDVMIRTHDDLTRVIAANPFADEAAAGGARVHVGFLAGQASGGAGAALQAIAEKYPARRDRYHLAGDHIYFHFPQGAGETKFAGKPLERAIGVPGTGRNWNTVLKLHQMSKPAG
ncbi:MAG TPA: DUF1697 domain-containing protein [Terracidiphilus sp.]